MTKVSPIPSKTKKKIKTFTFPQAITAVIKGKKIQRLEWEKKEYGFLNADILSLHKADEKNYQWVINDGDLLATDWIIIN